MSDRIRVPDLKGMKIGEAEKYLEENDIKYDKDYIYRTTLLKRRGTVIKTEPEFGKKMSKNKELEIYVSRLMLLPFFLVLLILIPGALYFHYGFSNIDYDADTSPYIVAQKEGWVPSNVVYVSKDAKLDNIDHYEYCIRQDEKKQSCEWNRTDTKNVEISTTGVWNVWFRAVNDKTSSRVSNMVTVYIDNDAPVIANVTGTATANSIHLDLDVKDPTSKIRLVEYSINGGDYIPVDNYENGIDINDLTNDTEYTICIRAYDEANNVVTVCVKVKTGDDEHPIDKLTPPIINLDKIPTTIEYLDDYEIPSYVWYANEGNTVCSVDGKQVTNTNQLTLGTNTISCTATDSSNGLSTSVEKTIMVKYQSEDPDGEEAESGWIWLTLYYPSNSTDWQYEIRNPKYVKTYKDGWQPYTGPILVHVDDVRNVFIKYILDGEVHIGNQSGRQLVWIEPEYSAVQKGEKTKVTIYYAKNAFQKLYKINNGPWKPYTEPFEVGPNTYVYAKVITRTPIYDGEGNLLVNKLNTDEDSQYISRYYPSNNNPHGPGGTGGSGDCNDPEDPECGGIPGTGNGPHGPGIYTEPEDPTDPEVLDGPTITSDPAGIIVDNTTVSITTAYPARKIMYSINNSAYKEYTGEFTVDYNCVIKAYYIRDEDGMRSQLSSYRISNVRKDKLPYILITANPDTLESKYDESTVTITTREADTLEYSLDGVVYVPYEGSFKVYETCTVYAHATNAYGDTYEQYTISLNKPPKANDKLKINITGNPAYSFSLKVDEIEVTIDYDSRATKKYYKIGEDGTYVEYTGPFKINKNTTVYAVATSPTGHGSAEKIFDYTKQGIANPIISATPGTAAQQVKIDITYDQNALVTQYRYGTMDWMDYEGSFYVTENTVIYARNINADGELGKASKKISNIVSAPNYRVLDKGDYLIIYVNYPETSPEDTREYKWRPDGTWKKYDQQGILLILPGVEMPKDDSLDGYVAYDDNNKKVVFTDHYYFLETGIEEISEYLYARWGDGKGFGPTFVTSTQDMAPSVEVGIVYREHDVLKQYRIVDSNGTSDWMDYTGQLVISEEGTKIYAKSMTAEGNWSDISNITIENIDNEDPTIKVTGNLDKPVDELPLKVKATDNHDIQLTAWVRGEQEIPYFWSGASDIHWFTETADIKLTENGKYTFYAMDGVGRETVKIIDVQNIGKNPMIMIDDTKWTTSKVVTINYHEGLTDQYSLDYGITWKTYTGPVTLDNQGVIIARSLQGNTVVGSASFTVNNIDITTPTVTLDFEDEILLNSDHPVPTSYTVNNNLSGGEVVCKDEKNRNITNLETLGTGEHTVMCTVTTGAGKKASAKKTFNVVRNLYSVDYYCTQDVQEWVAPVNGLYKFSAYGAQGGSLENAEGGKGGFVSGEISLYEGNKFYIYVGCAGSDTQAGYNGGGQENAGGASGGGASHIATTALGELYNYENNTGDIILVAGAGGGAGSKNGGAGGSKATAGDGYYGEAATAGTLTEAGRGGNNAGDGSFGRGGSITSNYVNHVAGAGGAGYYGGGAGGFGSPSHAEQDGYGGAGGSSYASDKLKNVKQESGVKYDDGYVKITLLDQYEKETPTFTLGNTHLDIDTEMVDVVNTLNYDGDGDLTVESSNPDIVSVYIDDNDNIILNPGSEVGDATITVRGSRAIIYKEGKQTFTVNNKRSPFFNMVLDEKASTTNVNVYKYEYVGNGTISLQLSNNTNGTAVMKQNASTTDVNGDKHSSGTITVTAKALDPNGLTATITITGDENFRAKKFVKRYTFTDPTVVTSSNDTAFQTALTEWGTISKSGNNQNWYGTSSKTDTKIQDYAKGDYVIVETVNTTEWTGYYYQYKDPETGKYVIPQYKYTELDFDMTSTDGDDDVLGAMIRFNPQGFNSTTGANNGKFTGYFMLLDNHANTGTSGTGSGGSSGYNNGNSNGIWTSNGTSEFSTACTNWSGSGSCKKLVGNRKYWWTRKKWQHYKFIADGSSLKVYRWEYNANGKYTIGSGSTLLFSTTNTSYATGTYGFWTESQAYAQFKNFKAITRDIDGFKITQYDE